MDFIAPYIHLQSTGFRKNFDTKMKTTACLIFINLLIVTIKGT